MVTFKAKNAIIDSVVVVLVIIIMGIAAVVGHNVFEDINTDIQADDDIGNTTKEVSGNLFAVYPSLMDNIFLFAFTLLIIFLLVSVFLLDTHPIYFILTIILLISVFIVALLLSNVYEDIMTDSELSDSANEFPFTSWVMDNMVQLIIAIGFLISIALFIKFKAG